MSSPKTQPTAASVEKFLGKVAGEETRRDCEKLVEMMRSATGEEPKMWGPSIVGFGTFHYVYASGHEGDWPLVAFSPRKQSLSLYLSCDIQRHADLLAELGAHTCGKGCLYIKRLADVRLPTLKKLIKAGIRETLQMFPAANKKPSKSRSRSA
jgi:hypothetical protein